MKKNEKLLSTTESVEDLFEIVELKDRASEHLDIEPYSYWKAVAKEFFKKKIAIFALVSLVIVALLSIFVPLLSTHDPRLVIIEPSAQFIKPTIFNIFNPELPNSEFFTHIFGTNKTGADIWTRVWYGARISMFIAIIVATLNMINGVIIGTMWGYFKKLDRIMIEVHNFIANVPALLYQMLLLYVLRSSVPTLIFIFTITGWLGTARSIRNLIIIYSNREYNIASRTLGTPAGRIIIHNLLPYILTVIITNFALSIPAVISAEVGLTYLGLGLPPGSISLGSVLKEGYPYFVSQPFVLFLPALVAGSITVIFYQIGLALADAMDPKNHR